MKNTFIRMAFVVLGSIVGYFIGVASKCPIHIILFVMLNGAFLGDFLGKALLWKKYGTLIWGVVATLIALIADWIAGSNSVSMLDKLAFALAGVFIGFDFWYFRKQVLVAGCIGGIIGFIWGLNDSLWFGHAHLEPGLLNATLSFVKFFIFGMASGSLYMNLFWFRRVTATSD